MKIPLHTRLALVPFLAAALPVHASPTLPGVVTSMQATVDAHEIAGAVTLVAAHGTVQHLAATGFADLETRKPMPIDAMFWIASMTKPITSVAILMLQDEGKLNVNDPVAKYLPEFASLKTPSGKPANLTIAQLLTHTSGLADPKSAAARSAKTLRELTSVYLSEPMQFEPGTTWRYTTSGFNVAGLVVETVSGEPFDAFLQDHLFGPLGMKDTTFFPSDEQRLRIAHAYRAKPATGEMTLQRGLGPNGPIPTRGDAPPLGGGGLFSTASDYARFGQMLLNRGTLDGRRYLSEDAYRALTTVCTGDLPTGYTKTKLSHVLGWGLGVAVVRQPGGGVSGNLSAGSFGHPGAWGTAAWIDPARGAVYVMMVQRSNMPDNFENPPALAFVSAASEALTAPATLSSYAARYTLNPHLPTLWIVGASAVRNGHDTGDNGQWGWGNPIASFFDRGRINVVNFALGGTSTRTYRAMGLWDHVLRDMKPGDSLLIQFGSNDASPLNDAKRARGTLPGNGEETQEIDNMLTKKHEVVHTFGWYLRQFIEDARAKGVSCEVVISPDPKNAWKDGKVERSRDFADWARAAARQDDAWFVDANTRIADAYDLAGQNVVTTSYFPAGEVEHTDWAGAILNARCIVAGIRELDHCALSDYLLPSSTDDPKLPSGKAR